MRPLVHQRILVGRYPPILGLVSKSRANIVSRYKSTAVVSGKNKKELRVLLQPLAHVGIRVYSLGKFPTTTSCDLAHALGGGVRVLLLAGAQGDPARQSTLDLTRCLKSPPQVKNDLTLTGANLPSSTGEQEEAYDRPVIEFFDKALR